MATSSLGALIANIYEAQATLIEPKLKALGISWSTFQILSEVRAAKGGVSQAEIARRLGVRPATLCEAVQEMARKGLLTQEDSSSDRRMKALRLTPSAEAEMRKIRSALTHIETSMVAGFSEKQIQQCESLLTRALGNLESKIESM